MCTRPPDWNLFDSPFEHEGIEVLGPALDFKPSLVGSPVSDVGSSPRFQCDMTNDEDDYFPFDDESEYDYSDSDDPFEYADPVEFSSRPVLLSQIRSCDDESALVPLISAVTTVLLKKVCNLHGSKPARRHFASLPAPRIPSNVHSLLDYYVNEELLGIRLCLDDHNPPRELALLLGIPTRPLWLDAVRAALPPLPADTRILDLKPVHYADAGKRILGRFCSDDFLDTGSLEHCIPSFSAPVEKLDVGLSVHPTLTDVVSPSGTFANDCGTDGNQSEGQPTLTSASRPDEMTATLPDPSPVPVSVSGSSVVNRIPTVDISASESDAPPTGPAPLDLSPSGLLQTSDPLRKVFGPILRPSGIPTPSLNGLTDDPLGSKPDGSPPFGTRMESSPLDLSRTLAPGALPKLGSQLVPFDRKQIDACVELPRQPTHSSLHPVSGKRSSIPLELELRSGFESWLSRSSDQHRPRDSRTCHTLLAPLEHPRERPAPLPGPHRTVLAS
jgi:hypothetical protein